MRNLCFAVGFTLIELLIVVAIIAILAAIAVPNFLEAQTRAKVVRSKSMMRTVSIAMEAYAVDNNQVAPVMAPGDWDPPEGRNIGFVHNLLSTPIAYLTSIPTDPFNEFVYEYPGGPRVTWNRPGQFTTRLIGMVKKNWGINPQNSDKTWNQIYTNFMQVLGAPVNTPYMFCSAGPDHFRSVISGMPSWGGGYYDPTNGTVSEGDIVWFGGTGFPTWAANLPAKTW